VYFSGGRIEAVSDFPNGPSGRERMGPAGFHEKKSKKNQKKSFTAWFYLLYSDGPNINFNG